MTELESYLQWIDDLRKQVIDLIAGADAEALNWRPIAADEGEATNSLAVLAVHIAGAEHFWIAEVVGGRPSARDRNREFLAHAASKDELLLRLNDVAIETRQAFGEFSMNGALCVEEISL